jgi:hypothetical protein
VVRGGLRLRPERSEQLARPGRLRALRVFLDDRLPRRGAHAIRPVWGWSILGGVKQLPFPLAGLLRRAVHWRFSALAREQADPFAAQQRAYRRLRRRLEGTEVARISGLAAAPDLRAFAASVPPHDYAFFEDLVDRTVDRGERSLLFHGPPVFAALTSGTSGGSGKRIVYDRAGLKCFDGYELAIGVIIMQHTEFNPFLHDRLNWGMSAPPTRTAAGVEQGYISGYMAAHPRFGRSHTVPPPAISEIADVQEKIRVAAPLLRGRSIHLSSSSPSYLLHLLEELRVLWGVEDFSGIWPDYGVVMYGATSILPYRAQITRLLGRPAHFLGMYVATEGPLGYEIPSLNGGVNGLYSFHLGDIVFTFRRTDGDGGLLTVGDLAPGDEVEVMITTPNGLVQYRIGDCLKIHGTRPLLFEIAGRVGHGLNVAGEKASLGQLTRAAARAADLSPTPVRHHFVCPGSSARGRSCYDWILVVDRPEAVDRGALADALERALIEDNAVYGELRADAFLDPPRVDLLGAEIGRRYFERDAHRGQLKMKSAFDTREALDAFLAGLGATR